MIHSIHVFRPPLRRHCCSWLSADSRQEWRYYGGDAGGTRYSPLDQIDKKNVGKLRVAWVYDTGDFSDGKGASVTRSSFEGTPLVVDDTMYVTTPFNRLIALEAETGKKKWEFDPQIDRSMRANLFVNRGVFLRRARRSLQSDLRRHARPAVVYQCAHRKAEFEVWDIRLCGREEESPRSLSECAIPNYFGPGRVRRCSDHRESGFGRRAPWSQRRRFCVRCYDGGTRWRFHTVPREGEAGVETWEGTSWKDRGGANMWSAASVDPWPSRYRPRRRVARASDHASRRCRSPTRSSACPASRRPGSRSCRWPRR